MNFERQPDQELSLLLSAMLDGQMTDAEESRLAELLRDNPDAQESYLDYCRTHALLRQELGGRCDVAALAGEEAVAAAGSAVEPPGPLAKIGNRRFLGDNPPASAPFPSIVLQPFSDQNPAFAPLGNFVFSYSLAALIIGVGMLIGWACKVSNQQVASAPPPPPAIARHQPQVIFVGRVTGMVDCRWSDAKTATTEYAYVPLGRKYALASGLMEITYDSGAAVILEGPCSYTAETKSGGYLGVGRLTARVEKKVEGGGRKAEGDPQISESHDRKSPNLQISKSPNLESAVASAFAIRTPTARLTDLGTEFGVAVDKSGLTDSHVFRGRVLLAALGRDGRPQGRMTTLAANESARVEKAAGNALVVRRDKVEIDPANFVRREQFAAKARHVRELPLKPFRRWQVFSQQLRKRGDLLAYYDFQRDPGDRATAMATNCCANRASTGGKFDGRLVGSITMGMARGRVPGKDALRFNYPGDGVRINIPGEFPRLTLMASMSLERCNGLAGIIMTDDWGQPGQFHWQCVRSGTIKFALAQAGNETRFQFDSSAAADFGRWHTWITVYDAPAGRVASYVDGRLLQQWKWGSRTTTDYR